MPGREVGGTTETLVTISRPRSVAAGSMTALLNELVTAGEPPLPGEGEPQPGERIGRFEVLRETGRGGFGVVYEARDETLGRLVALKLLKPGRRRRELGARWLVEEAEAAAQLQHPNIVALHDLGSHRGNPYLVLELLRGETLADRLHRGPLTMERALDVATQVARALAHAHGRGVLHRDLKPGNVFLCEDGTAKLLDFGLSRLIGAAGSKSGGTPAYMAPEQWRSEGEDARADVFALGVLLHHAIAGEPPWAVRDGRSAVLDAGPTPRLSGVARDVADLVKRMIEPDPVQRPQNGAVALEALRALGSRSRRRRAWKVAGAVLLAVVGLLGAGAWWGAGRAGSAPAEPVRVAVADVVNETGEPELDALSGLLITSLEQSGRLAVLTRGRMLDLHRQTGGNGERIDEAAAREVGRRAGIKALMLATVQRFGDLYSIEMRALDPEKDEYLFTAKADGRGKESIPGLVDRVSESARLRLKEARAEIAASFVPAESVTANLEAYRHYFKGLELAARYDFEATREFRRALELDPGFVLARHELLMIMRVSGDPEPKVRAVLEEVARDRDRLPAKERALHDAYAAFARGEWDAARSQLRDVASRYPEEKWVLALAGWVLGWELGDWSEALTLYERAFDLDPDFEVVTTELIELIAIGRGTQEALKFAGARVAAHPTSPRAWSCLWEASAFVGDFPGMEAASRRIVELEPAGWWGKWGAENVAFAKYLQDDYAGARAWLDREQELGSSRESVRGVRGRVEALERDVALNRAMLLVAEGRFREANETLDGLATAVHDSWTEVPWIRHRSASLLAGIAPGERFRREARRCVAEERFCAARLAPVAAAAGDMTLTRELLGAGSRSPWRDDFSREIAAVYDLSRRDAAGALAGLAAMKRSPYDGAVIEYVRASVCFEAGDHACAVEAYRRYSRRSGLLAKSGAWRAWAYPQALYREAVSLDRLGRTSEARARVEHLLRLWKNADPDLPLLHDANTLRARLASAR